MKKLNDRGPEPFYGSLRSRLDFEEQDRLGLGRPKEASLVGLTVLLAS